MTTPYTPPPERRGLLGLIIRWRQRRYRKRVRRTIRWPDK